MLPSKAGQVGRRRKGCPPCEVEGGHSHLHTFESFLVWFLDKVLFFFPVLVSVHKFHFGASADLPPFC